MSFSTVQMHIVPDASRSNANPFLPPGSVFCLEYIVQYHPELLSHDLAVVDYRYPGLSVDVIKHAHENLRHSSASILASLCTAVDHPAQFDAYYRIVEFDYLAIFDSDAPPDNRFAADDAGDIGDVGISLDGDFCWSKPLFFDWSARGIEAGVIGSRIFVRLQDTVQSRFFPRDTLADTNLSEDVHFGGWFWFEGPCRARRILRHEEFKNHAVRNLRGASFLKKIDHSPVILFRGEADTVVEIFVRSDLVTAGTLIRIWPLNQEPAIPHAESQEIHWKGLSDRQETFRLKDSKYLGGMGSIKLEEKCHAMLIALLQPVDQGTADVVEPLELDLQLWQVDRVTKRRRNALSGKPIMGRQDFPDVYHACSALTIFKNGNIPEKKSGFSGESLEPFVLHGGASMKIVSEFDLIRFQAAKMYGQHD
ncbi:hypothetical protein DSCA_06480 [Desulfosarcina alkanivorans]|uniref:Uncharacterized protein n=2 Tax=Desulfosarcina alkanivorans TaxID=571177 RepID=A0A5K7YC44_9BACT|nr:hypothetical protein DSCA_06480 [Desulfosarcina alkanivorans]